MTLPNAYKWLEKEPGPKMLLEALRLYGTTEKAGAADNPAILAWAKELDIPAYVHDSIAWCGLFVAICVKRAGWDVVNDPLWAANWLSWGNASPAPALGDVLVFSRPGGNHVGIYVGEDRDAYHVLGGNQSDAVNVKRLAKSRLRGARRAPWRVSQPENVRRVTLQASGSLSTNEA